MLFDGLNDVDLEASLRAGEYVTPNPLRSLMRDEDPKNQIFAVYINGLVEREWSLWWKSWRIRKLRLSWWIANKRYAIYPWLRRKYLFGLKPKWKGFRKRLSGFRKRLGERVAF